jgi:hypothetical protein
MFYDALYVTYVKDYLLEVVFKDGARGCVDFSDIEHTGVFARFADPDYFRQVYIAEGVLTWPPGDIDIAPETVYERATGSKEVFVQ